jgi:hypothetical protein
MMTTVGVRQPQGAASVAMRFPLPPPEQGGRVVANAAMSRN